MAHYRVQNLFWTKLGWHVDGESRICTPSTPPPKAQLPSLPCHLSSSSLHSTLLFLHPPETRTFPAASPELMAPPLLASRECLLLCSSSSSKARILKQTRMCGGGGEGAPRGSPLRQRTAATVFLQAIEDSDSGDFFEGRQSSSSSSSLAVVRCPYTPFSLFPPLPQEPPSMPLLRRHIRSSKRGNSGQVAKALCQCNNTVQI